jgi:AraC family transcriptional regulator
MKPQSVPITMGSMRSRSLETGTCLVTEAWFPAGSVLEPHTHSRPVFAFMLAGGFLTGLGSRRLDCRRDSAWTEPREERHDNRTGPSGAHVVVIQPDPARDDIFAPYNRLLDEIHLLREPAIALDARRLATEFRAIDTMTPLAAESLVLGMMTSAMRLTFGRSHHPYAPRWLLDAREMLHAHFRDGLRLSSIAEAVGVHPSHLAHAFRAHFAISVGAYARKLRFEWAAERLADPAVPIAEIALLAGYSDQSHFTRDCRMHLGIGPGAYRRAIGVETREG